MSYRINYLLKLGLSYSGLQLRAQLVNSDGSTYGDPITAGFIERHASGNYLWAATIPDQFQGLIDFYDGNGSYLDSIQVNPQEGENNDIRLTSLLSQLTALIGNTTGATNPVVTAVLDQLTAMVIAAIKNIKIDIHPTKMVVRHTPAHIKT